MPLSITKPLKLQKGENDLEFKQAVVTQNGRALMAKLLAGKSTQFTKIKVSSTIYPDAQLANLTSLTNIKQETTAQAYGNNTATVSVVGAIENTGLQTGYYINTVGLYAVDPDKGEILYSVSSASVNGYMPPDTGVSKSGFEFKIYSEVGNATQVDLNVDPAAFATHEDIERLSTLNTAYSWSSDGTDRFGTEYPRENLFKKTDVVNLGLIATSIATIQSGSTYRGWFLPVTPGEVYSIQRVEPYSVRFSYVFTTELPSSNVIFFGGNYPNIRDTISNIVVPTNARYLFIYLSNASDDSSKFNVKVEKGASPSIYTPSPSEDYENAYPDYIGLAPGYSDKPEDYVWLPEPNKNQTKLDELIELKGQVSDIQDWIQAHS